MRIYKNNDLKTILKVVSVNTNIPEETVNEVFSIFYKNITEIISKQDKENILEYDTIKIPFLGKIFISNNKKKVLKRLFEQSENGEDKVII